MVSGGDSVRANGFVPVVVVSDDERLGLAGRIAANLWRAFPIDRDYALHCY